MSFTIILAFFVVVGTFLYFKFQPQKVNKSIVKIVETETEYKDGGKARKRVGSPLTTPLPADIVTVPQMFKYVLRPNSRWFGTRKCFRC